MSIKRLRKELQELQKDPPVNCSAGIINDDINTWDATIIGPEKTPYSKKLLMSLISIYILGCFQLYGWD